jgi:hypothetical protein
MAFKWLPSRFSITSIMDKDFQETLIFLQPEEF